MPVQRPAHGVPARPTAANRDPLAMTDQTELARSGAQAFCDALVAGDVDRAIGHLSDELQRNLGEVMALLPLPAVEASIGSIEHSGSGAQVIVLDVVGETDHSQIQTRWKDRDGQPRIFRNAEISADVVLASTCPPQLAWFFMPSREL